MRTDPRSGGSPASRPRLRRDRRGRGMRAGLAPRGVPLHRTPAETFDDLVLDAVEELEAHLAQELAGMEFAVQEVPPDVNFPPAEFGPEIVVDHGVALGRLFRAGIDEVSQPVLVLYRRPIEARTPDIADRADVIFMIVAELLAEWLGRDIDEIHPPR